MPCWLITSTFYGQWLPGNKRGSVTNVRERRSNDALSSVRREHSQPGQAFDGSMPGLYQAALEQLKGQPVCVDLAQADQLLDQFLETAAYRGWVLGAVSIMENHVHLVVEPPASAGGGIAMKSQLLRDFKGYGSRRLNRLFGEREAGTWWSDGGSARIVKNKATAIHYVCHCQPWPLVVWSRERGRIPVEESSVGNRRY